MPHCPYIGADCDKMGNAFACDQVRAVACHERREKLLKEKEAKRDEGE